MNIRLFLHTVSVLLLFLVTGCNDEQEMFFEDYADDKAVETVHIEHRDKPYPREEHELYINPAPLLVPRAARRRMSFWSLNCLKVQISPQKERTVQENWHGMFTIFMKPCQPGNGIGVSVR